jgi:CO dehydrogenase/acetyl-CoA synthase delta subunit
MPGQELKWIRWVVKDRGGDLIDLERIHELISKKNLTKQEIIEIIEDFLEAVGDGEIPIEPE